MKHRGNEASGETQLDASLVAILLADRSSGAFIRWACNAYTTHGESYAADQEIYPHQVHLIQERTRKTQEEQRDRTKKSAEVFTPAWLCNAMINARDAVYFGREEVFNRMEAPSWTPTRKTIDFPTTASGRRLAWERYIDARCLEITCGEAPFLVSRYDAADGRPIPLAERIGILDRKLRIIGEHTCTAEDWFHWAKRALESAYAYEYQGDSLFLARLNLFLSISEYHRHLWKRPLNRHQQEEVARILSWNLWQMDGLTATTPFVTKQGKPEDSLFDFYAITAERRPLRSLIRDWRGKKTIRFSELNLSTTMKFDFVIGNPPYQEMSKNNKMTRSIYPDFVRSSQAIGQIVSLVMPARWMSGENGPYRETQHFIDEMLKGDHLQSFHLYPNSSDLFPNVDIKGGVCFFVWNRAYSCDRVNYTITENGAYKKVLTSFRIAENVIIRFPELISILEKTKAISTIYLNTWVSSRNPFGFISDLFTKNKEGVSRISEEKQQDDYLVHGLLKNKRVIRYIPNSALKKNIHIAHSYKVFLPRANGSGVFGEVFSTPMIGTPMMICTETFLQIGVFDNCTEAENLLKYVKTKYFRTMVGIKKTAVFNYKECFTFVPLQDFTAASDIDWSRSVAEIDRQLYAKYGLSAEEVAFIEEKIKPME
ncbi:MAG TPA: Eco57I restriction-modification methylase domain-containing protein [Akkermansia muciniphila]|nr:Eco57I restriction-modification methylase domain-containing protein [Akkermansia muciniphila]